MSLSNFRPMLCPNELPDLDKVTYPMLASFKLDGIRCIFKDGELLSRSLKELPNIHLHVKFAHLKEYSKKNNVILDGELYCTSVDFNALSGIIRSDEHDLPDDLEFYCFDLLDANKKTFKDRVQDYMYLRQPSLVQVAQTEVNSAEEVQSYFEHAIKSGYEGLILKDPSSYYKFGRASFKSNTAYKCKLYESFDAQIIDITQATVAREGSEKKVNELGRSVTSQKKADRELINKAATFIVLYNNMPLGVSIALTDEEKEEIWANKHKYIGRWIQYKGMLIGSKDLPRHPVFERYRDDKNS